MRIIAGTLRGRKLFTPKGFEIRPATDRVRQYIFDCIRGHLPDADVLDLFAGTGSVGIEALSRGAKFADFVDNSLESASLIKKNIESLSLEKRSKVFDIDAFKFVEKCDRRYDLIFLDPPYRYEPTGNLAQKTASSKILKSDGLLIIEHDNESIIPELLDFNLLKQKKFGRTIISILTLK